MNQAFTLQLDLKILKINIKAQKIDSTSLETYEMVISIYFVLNKDGRVRFFKKSFLLANVKQNIVLKMLFLIIINANINFKIQAL